MTLVSLVTIGSLLFASADVWAQRGGGGRPGVAGQGYQYVIKFVCGEVDNLANVQDNGPNFLAPGEYFTVINIHNPNEEIADYGIDWFKKVVTDYYNVQTVLGPTDAVHTKIVYPPQKEAPYQVIAWVNQDSLGEPFGTSQPPREKIQDYTLSRDEAAQMNCHEIHQILGSIDNRLEPSHRLLKGYVVIYSKLQLDITAVYTACGFGSDVPNQGRMDCENVKGGGVQTINVQRIQPNGILPPDGIGLPDDFPTTTQNADCPPGGCQYVIKFICGELNPYHYGDEGQTYNNISLAPGEYYTEINVHNPNPNPIQIKKKFAADSYDPPIPEVHGPVSSPIPLDLEVDDAVEISCQDVREELNAPFPRPPFIKGFVVVYSRYKLDITAMYTVCAPGAQGMGCHEQDDLLTKNPVVSWEVRQGPDKFLTEVPPPERNLPAEIVGSGLHGDKITFNLQAQGSVPLESAQVQVFDLYGRLIHDTGRVQPATLSWKPLIDGRPLANGVYIYVYTAKDVLGNTIRRIGKFVYLR